MEIDSLVDRLASAGSLRVIESAVDPVLEAAALIRGSEPGPVLLRNVGGAAVLANIMRDRAELARGLEVDPERFLAELEDLLDGRASRAGAGITAAVRQHGDREISLAELNRFPFLTYYRGDGGPYLTAGVWVVRDPAHGVNLSYHRLMMTSSTRGTVRVVEGRGTDTALKNSGGRLEAAVCIGAPMPVMFAASLSPAPDVSEMSLAARFGRLEMARCGTVDLEVPASCQAVIEGRFTGEVGPEGPFVDITGTMDLVRQQPVFEITRVTCRRDPIHYTIVPGRADHKTLMGVPKELDIYRAVGKVCRCLDVRITPGGCAWLHAVVKIGKVDPDDGRRALEAAFAAHRSLKHCVVVDDDIDLGDPSAVEWALATRFQADEDLLLLTDQPGSSLDPSARHRSGKKSVGAKLGLDATIRSGHDRSLFKLVES